MSDWALSTSQNGWSISFSLGSRCSWFRKRTNCSAVTWWPPPLHTPASKLEVLHQYHINYRQLRETCWKWQNDELHHSYASRPCRTVRCQKIKLNSEFHVKHLSQKVSKTEKELPLKHCIKNSNKLIAQQMAVAPGTKRFQCWCSLSIKLSVI